MCVCNVIGSALLVLSARMDFLWFARTVISQEQSFAITNLLL